MQLAQLTRFFSLLVIGLVSAKPAPGSHTHLSITAAPTIVPAKVVPVASPAHIAYNTPVLAYNVPLDAAFASQRIDVQQRYNSYLPPLRVVATPYVEPRRLIYASPYVMPAPYYAPNYVAPLRYSVPIGPPVAPLLF